MWLVAARGKNSGTNRKLQTNPDTAHFGLAIVSASFHLDYDTQNWEPQTAYLSP